MNLSPEPAGIYLISSFPGCVGQKALQGDRKAGCGQIQAPGTLLGPPQIGTWYSEQSVFWLELQGPKGPILAQD